MALSVDSGTYTDSQIAARRKLAQSMLDQSMSETPISAHTQGLARLAKALIGGSQMHELDEESKAEDKATTDALLGLPGLPASPQASTSVASGAGPMPAAPTVTASDPGDLRSFIKQREGFSPTTHADFKQQSNGFGTRALPGETGISEDEANKRLDVEIGKATNLVEAFAPDATAEQKRALADLTYNTGNGWMAQGLGAAVKSGNWPLAQQLFLQYTKAGGQEQPGLVDRRKAMAPLLMPSPMGPVQVADASGQTVPQPGGEPQLPNFAGGMPSGTTMAGANGAQPPAPAPGSPSPQAAVSLPAAPGAAPALHMDPATAQKVKALIANPRTRNVGLTLYNEMLKKGIEGGGKFGKEGAVFQDPTTKKFYTAQFAEDGTRRIQEIKTDDGQALTPSRGIEFKGDTAFDKATAEPVRDVSANIAGGKTAEAVGDKGGEYVMGKPREDALAAVSSLQNVREARRLLDAGIVTGKGAGMMESARGWADTLGIGGKDNQELLANTQTFAAQMGREVGNIIRMFGAGTGLSDADRTYAQKIAGGEIELSEESLRKITDINERLATAKIKSYNDMVSHVRPDIQPFPLRIDLPSENNDLRPAAPQNAQATTARPSAAGKVRTYNPATGMLE